MYHPIFNWYAAIDVKQPKPCRDHDSRWQTMVGMFLLVQKGLLQGMPSYFSGLLLSQNSYRPLHMIFFFKLIDIAYLEVKMGARCWGETTHETARKSYILGHIQSQHGSSQRIFCTISYLTFCSTPYNLAKCPLINQTLKQLNSNHVKLINRLTGQKT